MLRIIMLFVVSLIPTAQADEAALKLFLEEDALKSASVGFCLIPLEGNDDPLLAHQADLGLIPASSLKAVTTATALQVLGKDYHFITKLLKSGDDLIIKGGGDPTLAAFHPDAAFPVWLTALREKGLTEIAGDLILDTSHFESRAIPNEWPWGDVGNYYGAGAWGLNYHQNLYALTFRPGDIGAPAELIKTFPTPPRVRFDNHMRTGTPESGDHGYVYGGPHAEVVTLRGTIPQGTPSFTIRGALPNPPLTCGMRFRDYLQKEKFPISGEVKLGQGEGKELYRQESPSLETIIMETNHQSINLYAECLLKALTPQGTTAAGLKKLRHHWASQGIDLTGFVAYDGSGLSPRNTITSRQLALILKKARAHASGEIFEASLPLAGSSGTISSLKVAGHIRAKSGGLTRVRTYTGYLTTTSKKRYAFALMINNHVANPRTAIVRFLDAVIQH